MKRILVLKRGAAGDVVRTTPLLHRFSDAEIDWFTAPENRDLVPAERVSRVLTDVTELSPAHPYSLVISLEDDVPFLQEAFPRIVADQVFGAYFRNGVAGYSDDSAEWFDLGLMSRYGLKEADARKLKNRSSYQEIIFRGLGLTFRGERYVLPSHLPPSDLSGDIAIAPQAGARWPAKNWAFFDELISILSAQFRVTILPSRPTILHHLSDIRGHRLVVSGDSLPMHLGIGLGLPCVAIFTCTSPWEIYEYGLLKRIVSPKLEQFFYTKERNPEAVGAIPLDVVHNSILNTIGSTST